MLGGMLGTVTGSFAGGVASSDPAHGIVRATDFAVTQNGTPNMSVNVAAGGAFIRGTQNANQGAYHVWNDGTVNLSISAADATNGRRDLVIAQVRDAFYSGATNDARITVVTGTAAASPVDPSLASFPNALVLARITVAAGDTAINTADITDLRTVANQVGKIPTYNTSALATTAIPSPVDGQAYYLNLGTTGEGPYWFNGSSYTRPWHMPWGAVGLHRLTTSNATAATHTTLQANGLTTTFNAVNNRNYKLTMVSHPQANGGANSYTCNIYVNGVAVVGSLSMFVNQTFPTVLVTTGYHTTTATASMTVAGFHAAFGTNTQVTDTGTTNLVRFLMVEDIGPSGAPS